MRVYGASPLYNYVELIFRSKRLFIICIVLATLIVSTLATLRGKTYTAEAMILLTGKEESVLQTNTEEQQGSVNYKLNLLSIYLKDPNFFREAITTAIDEMKNPDRDEYRNHVSNGNRVQYHFDPNMPTSGTAFEKFYKDAKNSLSWAQGNGILQINCRWQDEHAADIINAFYWLYHDKVVGHETSNSINQVTFLKKTLDVYTNREQQMEQAVIKFKKDNVESPITDDVAVNQQYLNEKTALDEMKVSLTAQRERRDEYKRQLETMKPRMDGPVEESSVFDRPEVREAQKKKEDAQALVDERRKRYSDLHPSVKEALANLDTAEQNLKRVLDGAKKSPYITRRTTLPNQEYIRQQSLLKAEEAALKSEERRYDLRLAHVEQLRQAARQSGEKNYKFKWLTDQYGLISQIRTNLQSTLEASQLAAAKEEERHSNEIAMLVPPIAELETTGLRNAMLYAAGPILGVIIAFAFSLVLETLDHSLRTPVEVEKHLGKPVLAVLPRMDVPVKLRRKAMQAPEMNRASLPPGS